MSNGVEMHVSLLGTASEDVATILSWSDTGWSEIIEYWYSMLMVPQQKL